MEASEAGLGWGVAGGLRGGANVNWSPSSSSVHA